MNYSIGQRWQSTHEPELGLGVITYVDKRFIDCSFPTHEIVRRYTCSAAPLRRILFSVGDIIRDVQGNNLKISALDTTGSDAVVVYVCQGVRVRENALADTIAIASPLARFTQQAVDSSESFDFRLELQSFASATAQSPVRGYAGGRIDLLVHQLSIAESVSSRKKIRALLADETGLGKTIEACLILHRLLAQGRVSRVLVIVPDHLVYQWFVELLRRFNRSFTLFTEEYCEGCEKTGNPFLSEQTGICGVQFLSDDPKRLAQALNATWDLVIVDEAHHLAASGPVFSFVQTLAKTDTGLLLLTATPEHLGRKDHFERLKVLDPDRYTSFEVYEQERLALEEIQGIIKTTCTAQNIDLKSADLRNVMCDVPLHMVERIPRDTTSSSKNSLSCSIADLIDWYGTGRIVFRNTRRNITGFPERKVHLTEIPGDNATVSPLFEEAAREWSKATQSPPDIVAKKDPRLMWLGQLTKELPEEKILVICTHAETTLALQKALNEQVRLDTTLFHEGMTILQRDRSAAWFADPEGARILLCSELGSEGRNFQFCHHLVLFDLPLHPETLEQRIGRLDRIGQAETIHIHVPYIAGSPQHVLAAWYHEGLGAFAQNIPAAGRVYDLMCKELAKLCNTQPFNADSLSSLVKRTHKQCEKLTTGEIEARDKLFELTSLIPARTASVIHELQTSQALFEQSGLMERLMTHYGIMCEDAGAGRHAMITELCTDDAFPLPRAERPVVTYDRAVALSYENVEFLTMDHPMVTGAIDLFCASETGTSSFALFEDPTGQEFLLETVSVVECAAPLHLVISRFLPPTVIRVVVNHLGEDVTAKYPADILKRHCITGNGQKLFIHAERVFPLITRMYDHATQCTQTRSLPIIEDALLALRRQYESEIERCIALAGRHQSSLDGDTAAWESEMELMIRHLKNAQVRCDALRFVRRGPIIPSATSDE